MDLDQAGADMPGRNEAFQQGSAGNPYRVASSMNGTAYGDSVGQGFHPTSVLNSLQQSSNGMSGQDYNRVLPGGVNLPTQNGSDSQTYREAEYMRMIGKPY